MRVGVLHGVRPALPATALVLALLVTLVPARAEVASADTDLEAAFVAAVNAERADAGLPQLHPSAELTRVARAHAGRMAGRADLYHNPSLGSAVRHWRKLGENVGRGGSWAAIHRAFLDSPGHRRNVLDPEWTDVGIGVVVTDGGIWVTELFRTGGDDEPGDVPSGPRLPGPGYARPLDRR